MIDNDAPDQVVAAPTYMADIRFFFRTVDVEHMAAKGIALGTYDDVKRNALAVLAHTTPPNATMPPDTEGKWSAAQSQTFKNWIVNQYPLGVASTPSGGTPPVGPGTGDRVRKDVTTLSAPEVSALQTAFAGVIARDPSDATSYFAIAGIHGLPEAWCLHHEDRFNPWHRVYLKVFEDALRSVPGCEDVTLPYWDITTPLPALLGEPPFDSYVFPQDPGATASPVQLGHFPYTTQRYPSDTIASNFDIHGVFADIDTSLNQSLWGSSDNGGYQDFSIQAHDGGHVSIGRTMADQNISSYDPVFWFYHCNLDRLWLQWQGKVHGLALTGFTSTVVGDTSWLSAPFNALPPFTTTADQTIAFGVSYDDQSAQAGAKGAMENKVGSVAAARSFSIQRSTPVSVRVKGIARLNIPGSFVVSLLADGTPIAKRAFFQPKSPRNCNTCTQHPLVNLDFRIDQEQLLGRKLSVEIDLPDHDGIGTRFPLAQAGDPSINARLLLEEE